MEPDRLLDGRQETIIGKRCDRHPELDLRFDEQSCPEGCSERLRLIMKDDDTGEIRIV